MRVFSFPSIFRWGVRIGLKPRRYEKDKRTKGAANHYTGKVFDISLRVLCVLCGEKSFSFLRVFVPLCLCVTLFAFPAFAQDTTSPDITFLSAPTVVQDQVTLQFAVRGAGGLGVNNLTAANFSLSEPAADLTVTAAESLPVSLAVILNLSYGSDLDLIQDTLRAYFNSYYRADDKVSFFILGAGDLQTVEVADLNAINSLIDGLTTSNEYLDISSALTAALNWLRELNEPNRPRLALYVGSFLNDPAEANASRSFALERIPFNVVQAHRFRQPATTAYRALATNGGGLFANNQDGSFVLDGTPVTAINTLKVMYDAMNGTRAVYTLSYRSSSTDLTPDRRITLTANLSDDQAAVTDFTYERQFSPPQVALVAANLSPLRQPSRVGDTLAFDIAEQPLAVSVTFPDGVGRKIASLRLEVTNSATGNVIQSRLELDPPTDSSGNYLIVWPLADYNAPGTSRPVSLTITAVDELGLSGTTTQEATVIVAALPPLPTPSAALTELPTLEPTVTLIPQNAEAPPIDTVSRADSGGSMFGILIAVILLLVVIVVFLMFALRRLRRRQLEVATQTAYMPVTTGTNAMPNMGTTAAPTYNSATASANGETPAEEEKKTLGRLIVINGLPEEEIVINEIEFVIGRKAESGCNYVINAPYISPRHCMFIYRNGNFLVRDLGAKNGTFVNGERIAKERDVIVPIGSEVGITQNITFELWDPFTVINIAGKRGDTQAEEFRSQITGDELIFRPMFGIKYSDDDDTEITDDYSPV